jgi:hypothetical protein
VLTRLSRTLRPAGWLLLAFHVGDEIVHLDEWWGHRVSVDFHFFQPDELVALLKDVGFAVGEIVERAAHPSVEYPSRRAYVFAARK